ncbi:MAG TPA: FecR domain-containing protein [Rhizomicrobium sp.]|nr:FecR domain-containing protein [Rhizomicrobium sp.]
MSDAKKIRIASAEDVEEIAALWIDRRDRSDWAAQDQAELDAWLAQSMTHSIAFWRLNAAWQRTERLAALQPGVLRSGSFFSREWVRPALARTAAALAIAAMLGGGAYYFLESAQHSYATTAGTREIVSLSDGSQIELNTDTTLHLSATLGERTVWLDRGEAYFQIKHDAAHPFIVFVAGHRVTDLGTKFSIRTDAQRTEVALTEGSARLEVTPGAVKARSVTLKPGDVAVATAQSVSVTKKPLHRLNNELGWLGGVLIFDNTTLADAAAQFNRYSQHKLVVEGSAANLKIDGTFPANDTAAFASIAEHILHLHARNNGSEIVISR